MERGWVKNYRKEMDWEWFTDPATAHLFHYLTLAVNHKATRYRGVDIPAGGMTTSEDALSRATGLSRQQVRTAIKHLISTNEITKKSTRKYTLLIVNNWEKYQSDNQQPNQQLTNKQPTPNQQLTTNKNERMKEGTNERNIQTMSGDKPPDTPAAEVIRYLNEKADKKFSPNSDASCKPINARIREGASIEDLKRVIDLKVSEWKDNETMNKYLRPQTLFGPQKFEQYMNEVPAKREKTKEEMQAEYGGTWL